MPKRSAVTALPAVVKKWLDAALVEGNFSGYESLSAELKKRGCDVSKSSLHRYGQDFQAKLDSLKLATEQARAVVDAAPDDEGAMNEALMRLVQEKLFGVLQDLQVKPDRLNIGSLGKTIAELARASVTQKKWATQVRERLLEKLDRLEKEVAAAGGEADPLALLKRVREDAYGLFKA